MSSRSLSQDYVVRVGKAFDAKTLSMILPPELVQSLNWTPMDSFAKSKAGPFIIVRKVDVQYATEPNSTIRLSDGSFIIYTPGFDFSFKENRDCVGNILADGALRITIGS